MGSARYSHRTSIAPTRRFMQLDRCEAKDANVYLQRRRRTQPRRPLLALF